MLAELYISLCAHLAENFERYWLKVLKPKVQSYDCSLTSLYVNHEELDRILQATLEDEKGEAIMIIGFLNAALLVIQMITHILMMIRWYRENPIIERRVKRSIKVD